MQLIKVRLPKGSPEPQVFDMHLKHFTEEGTFIVYTFELDFPDHYTHSK